MGTLVILGRSSYARHYWTIWLVSILHVVWGFLLMRSSVPAATTALSAVVNAAGSSLAAAFALQVTAGLSVWTLLNKDAGSARCFLMVLPQNLLTVIVAVGAAQAVVVGAYPDGVVRPSEFILADQLIFILVAVFHTAAVLDRATTARRPDRLV